MRNGGSVSVCAAVLALTLFTACGGTGSSEATKPTSAADHCRAAFKVAEQDGIWADNRAAYKSTLSACRTVAIWSQVAQQYRVPTLSHLGVDPAEFINGAMCGKELTAIPGITGDEPVCADAASRVAADG